MEKITIEREINLQLLNDAIITAVEGGSNYWYLFKEPACDIIEKYKGKYIPEIHGENGALVWCFSESILPAIMAGETIPIHDIEEEEGGPVGHLSLAKLKYGIAKMATDNRSELNCLFDENQIADANDADVIFQYICLGEIVYG